MAPSASLLEELAAIAQECADAAGAVIRPHYRAAKSQSITTKSDQSPVTEVDRAAEQTIRAIITKHRPQDGIFGEEFGRNNPEASVQWILDPIDGTKPFICGRPNFCTLIGVMIDHDFSIGIIDQPILQERWLGIQGQPSTFNGQPISTRPVKQIDEARLGSTYPLRMVPDDLNRFRIIEQQAALTILGGDAYGYGMLSMGGLDIVMEQGLQLYDIAALIPVITGAGGITTDWQGNALDQNFQGHILASANADIHAEILSVIS